TGREQILDRLLESRDHSRMVGGNTHLEAGDPAVVAEHGQVGIGEVIGTVLGDAPDLVPLFGGGEPETGIDDGEGGSVTTRPGEDEVQGGEHVEIPQGLDHLVTARSGVTPPPPAVQTQHALDPGIGSPAAVAGDEGGEETDLLASSVLDHVLV